MLSLFLPFRIV